MLGRDGWGGAGSHGTVCRRGVGGEDSAGRLEGQLAAGGLRQQRCASVHRSLSAATPYPLPPRGALYFREALNSGTWRGPWC